MEALNDVVRAGKVRYLGASSMFCYQFVRMRALAASRGWANFVAMQNLYNLLYREEEREMNRYCAEEGIAVNPWSPLARGFFAGNRGKSGGGETLRSQTDGKASDFFYQDQDFAIVEAAEAVAGKHGVKPIQVALAWILAKPGVVSPILGIYKEKYVEDAVAAVDLRLDAEDMESLEKPYRPRPVVGFFPEGRGA